MVTGLCIFSIQISAGVVFEGYVDDDEIMMCDNIVNAMEKTEIERADVRKLKRSMVN